MATPETCWDTQSHGSWSPPALAHGQTLAKLSICVATCGEREAPRISVRPLSSEPSPTFAAPPARDPPRTPRGGRRVRSFVRQNEAMEPGELEEGETPSTASGSLSVVFNGEAFRVAVSKAGTGEASAAFAGERLDISSFWNPGAAVASALATLLLGSDRSEVWVVESDAASPSPAAQKLHADCVGTGKSVRRRLLCPQPGCENAHAIEAATFSAPSCCPEQNDAPGVLSTARWRLLVFHCVCCS